jgi:hypothetical protein
VSRTHVDTRLLCVRGHVSACMHGPAGPAVTVYLGEATATATAHETRAKEEAEKQASERAYAWPRAPTRQLAACAGRLGQAHAAAQKAAQQAARPPARLASPPVPACPNTPGRVHTTLHALLLLLLLRTRILLTCARSGRAVSTRCTYLRVVCFGPLCLRHTHPLKATILPFNISTVTLNIC